MRVQLTLPLTVARPQQVKLNKLIRLSLTDCWSSSQWRFIWGHLAKTILILQLNVWLLIVTSLSTHTSRCPFNPRLSLSPLSVSSSGSRLLPMRKPTRPSGTETGWMLSWTGWPACCHSPRMSSPSWTSCPCCALQFPTSASRVSSKVKEVKRWHL